MPTKRKTKKLAVKKNISKEKKQKVRETIGKLASLAHSGTKEGLEQIGDFMAKTKDKELKSCAEIAKGEAEFFYFSPNNKQEEKDLLLTKIIIEHEKRVDRLIMKANAAKFELEKLDLERGVHKKLIKVQNKKKQEEWKYNFSEDFYMTVQYRLQGIEQEIEYEEKWIETARKIIKTKKYQELPPGFFNHYHWDYEDEDFWDEDLSSISDYKIEDIPF